LTYSAFHKRDYRTINIAHLIYILWLSIDRLRVFAIFEHEQTGTRVTKDHVRNT